MMIKSFKLGQNGDIQLVVGKTRYSIPADVRFYIGCYLGLYITHLGYQIENCLNKKKGILSQFFYVISKDILIDQTIILPEPPKESEGTFLLNVMNYKPAVLSFKKILYLADLVIEQAVLLEIDPTTCISTEKKVTMEFASLLETLSRDLTVLSVKKHSATLLVGTSGSRVGPEAKSFQKRILRFP